MRLRQYLALWAAASYGAAERDPDAATLAVTLEPATVTGTGAVVVGASAALTLGAATVAGSGSVVVGASAALALGAATVAAEATVAGDPLAALSDDFETGSTMTGNGWTIEDSTPSAAPSDLITSGEADLTVSGGGAGGSFWFDNNDGALWYKTVTGACDFRARVRVENAAGGGLPPATSFRIAGIQAADPDRSTYEYLHVGLGAINTGTLSIEWKSTDNSDSAYGGSALTLTGGEILYDLRIVRRPSDLQIFDLYVRAGTAEALASNTGWTLFQTIDRSDDTVPSRVANNGSVAVELPATLRWGFIIYALGSTHNIRMYVLESLFSTPS